jgi:hypothetical protein
MRRFRITLAVAMAAVVYLGFAFAAVLHPTALWADAWSTGNLVVLAVAVLGAIYSKGDSKVFWSGFAIVGGGFLALNIFPAQPLHLVTRGPAERYYDTLSHDPVSSEEFVWVSRGPGHEKWQLQPSFPGDQTERNVSREKLWADWFRRYRDVSRHRLEATRPRRLSTALPLDTRPRVGPCRRRHRPHLCRLAART